jgi:hypothetical protein
MHLWCTWPAVDLFYYKPNFEQKKNMKWHFGEIFKSNSNIGQIFIFNKLDIFTFLRNKKPLKHIFLIHKFNAKINLTEFRIFF